MPIPIFADKPIERRPPGGRRERAKPKFYFGLDVGQANDPTAYVIVETVQPVAKSGDEAPLAPETIYHVRDLGRAPLGTAYGGIVRGVADRIASDALSRRESFTLNVHRQMAELE